MQAQKDNWEPICSNTEKYETELFAPNQKYSNIIKCGMALDSIQGGLRGLIYFSV